MSLAIFTRRCASGPTRLGGFDGGRPIPRRAVGDLGVAGASTCTQRHECGVGGGVADCHTQRSGGLGLRVSGSPCCRHPPTQRGTSSPPPPCPSFAAPHSNEPLWLIWSQSDEDTGRCMERVQIRVDISERPRTVRLHSLPFIIPTPNDNARPLRPCTVSLLACPPWRV